MRSHLWLPLLVAASFAVCGCGDAPAPDDRLTVAVSVLPHAGLVERIAGDRIRVLPLVRPGESPATHQPTDAQVTDVLRAKVYFRTGVPFERGAWLAALEGAAHLRVVDLRTGVTLRAIEAHSCGHPGHDHGACEHGHGEAEDGDVLAELDPEADPRTAGDASPASLDPHIWTGPDALAAQARLIATVLTEIDPEGTATYEAGLETTLADLDTLKAELQATLAPLQGRAMYVFHPAWGYLCDAYGIQQRAIEIEGKEPSESELTELVASARQDGIRAVFVQQQFSGEAARAVADAVGAEVVLLDPLARDPIENLRGVARALAESL